MISSTAHTSCRICGATSMHRYLDLGATPLANSYVPADQLDEPELREELALQLCTVCGLSQLTRVVNPDLMFRNYLYVSSTPATFRDHCQEMAATVSRLIGAVPGDLALDIASNDGCLLRRFADVGMRVIGVDPAENLAREANASGIPTICDYWSPAVAGRVVAEHGRPLVITATNVFAHVHDLHAFMHGVNDCLAPSGVFVIECPYVLDFLEHNEFDTAYHEHLSYIGVTPIAHLANRYGFEIVDVHYFSELHGGTIRVVLSRRGDRGASEAVERFLARERVFGITDLGPHRAFADRVYGVRDALRKLLDQLRGRQHSVWAYGASAKGNTLANFVGLTRNDVPVVLDDNPKKWGYYCPGSHMEIRGTAALEREQPDYLLLLAWNFQQEIVRRSRAAGFRGGFIVPVPEPHIIDARSEAA